jgi:DnaJ-class molecular chaperone
MVLPDYYQILGISKTAGNTEIKTAYRKKVLKLHPDVTNGKIESFLSVQQAFEVLSDPVKRKAYDMAIQTKSRADVETQVYAKSRSSGTRAMNFDFFNRIVISALAMILFIIAVKL